MHAKEGEMSHLGPRLIAGSAGRQQIRLIVGQPIITGMVRVFIHLALRAEVLDVAICSGQRLAFTIGTFAVKQFKEMPLQLGPDLRVEFDRLFTLLIRLYGFLGCCLGPRLPLSEVVGLNVLHRQVFSLEPAPQLSFRPSKAEKFIEITFVIDRAELEIRIYPRPPDHSGLREPVMVSVNCTLTSASTFRRSSGGKLFSRSLAKS